MMATPEYTTDLSESKDTMKDIGGSQDIVEVPVTVPAAFRVPDPVHRGLRMRHIQLIAISGAVGAGVFVSIGGPLTHAGPLGLLLGIGIWSTVIWAFANCLIEITTLLPLPGGFVYYSGRFLDPSIRFALGWIFVVEGIAFVCFEVTALNLTVAFWKDNLHPAILITSALIALFFANGINVRYYGEIEFWISIFKVILMIGLFAYTFVTMVGGNPQHDHFGFRFWKNPGVFAAPDGWGRLKGIWRSLSWATFAMNGPDFLSMVAGETQNPRRIIPRAFKTTPYRIIAFYIGSAFCVGINTPYNDKNLLGAIAAGAPGAAKSPYIISMNRLGIPVLPDIVNAVIITSIFSTASSFAFTASRSLYSLALEGQAPKVFTRTNRWGVPYLAVIAVLLASCLSFLSVSNSAAKVLDWFVNLTSACLLICWICIAATYLRFRAGLKAQGLLHNFLPVTNRLQPFSGWYGFCMSWLALIFTGYYLMEPGGWAVADFIFAYGAVFLFIFLFACWKVKGLLRKEEKLFGIPLMEMDFVGGVQQIEELTVQEEEARDMMPNKTVLQKVERALF